MSIDEKREAFEKSLRTRLAHCPPDVLRDVLVLLDGYEATRAPTTQQPVERTVSLKECQEVAMAEYKKFGGGILSVTKVLLKHLGVKYVD